MKELNLSKKFDRFAVNESLKYDDPGAFVREMAASDLWDDVPGASPEDKEAFLLEVYDMTHTPFGEISRRYGLPRYKFAEHLGIPKRTSESWDSGMRSPPMYVILMIRRLLDFEVEAGLIEKKPYTKKKPGKANKRERERE